MAPMREDHCEDSHYYMDLALQQAKFALEALEVPVGCVILEGGKVIASGRNRTNETRNATRHAEMEAIDQLVGQWCENKLSHSQVAEKFSPKATPYCSDKREELMCTCHENGVYDFGLGVVFYQ